MTNLQVKPAAVDWMTIYVALCYSIQPIPERMWADTHVALRNLRTIHMGGGRQNGKTGWAVNMLANEGIIIVAKDKLMRQEIEAMYVLKNPKKAIHLTIPADCDNPGELVEELLATHRNSARRKVFTVMDLQEILKENPSKLKDVSHVIIDDASYNTRTNEVYKVFGDLGMTETVFIALN